jgi:hypothetical protein
LEVHNHFKAHFANPAGREYTLNWNDVNLPCRNLEHLEEAFTEEEVLAVIQELAGDNAPGPDGYIGIFLKRCWHIIKVDVMQAFQFFFDQHDQHLRLLNSTHVVLIPKKQDAHLISDYRAISQHCQIILQMLGLSSCSRTQFPGL